MRHYEDPPPFELLEKSQDDTFGKANAMLRKDPEVYTKAKKVAEIREPVLCKKFREDPSRYGWAYALELSVIIANRLWEEEEK